MLRNDILYPPGLLGCDYLFISQMPSGIRSKYSDGWYQQTRTTINRIFANVFLNVYFKIIRCPLPPSSNFFISALRSLNHISSQHNMNVIAFWITGISTVRSTACSGLRQREHSTLPVLCHDHSLRCRHNDHAGVSNHQPHGCLLNRLFRLKWKITSKLRVTGLCAGNSPGTGEFPAQMASYAENVSIWWRHHGWILRTKSQ